MTSPRSRTLLRIGLIPLLDAAPLIAARELGIFEREGLDARITTEPGWATIRDRFVFGELDVAHALAGQAFDLQTAGCAGGGSSPLRCFLNRGGSFVVLGRRWAERGVADAAQLAAAARGGGRRLTFGAVHRLSSHRFLLEHWLEDSGFGEEEIQFVHLPPPLLGRALRSGQLDGFCAGEPWCTQAVVEEGGAMVASGELLAPDYPDKVLLLSPRLLAGAPGEAVGVVRAVVEAAEWCDREENHPRLAEMLSARCYLNVEVPILRQALAGSCPSLARTRSLRVRFDEEALRPRVARLAWLADQWRVRGWPGVERLGDIVDGTLFSEATSGSPA